MVRVHLGITAAAAFLGGSSVAIGANLPRDIVRQLPQGYTVLSSATPAIGARKFYLVALASRKEVAHTYSLTPAPARPLLIFENRAPNRYSLIARNDDVILRADEGGPNACDPFDGSIVVKGIYFTVENAMACGSHWTDYVTFRFNRRANGYVFDNWRTEWWSPKPNSEEFLLVSDGQKVTRSNGRVIPFAQWRRPSS